MRALATTGSLHHKTNGRGARVKDVVRTRHFMAQRAVRARSTPVLSSSQSPYPVGSQIADETLLFSATQLSNQAQDWIQQHDKYRIEQLELFCTLTVGVAGNESIATQNLPVEVYFYEDVDADPATLTSWIRVRDRDNLGKVTLNAYEPTVRLLSFRPTPTFAASDTAAQSPSNMIPDKNAYLDALATSQLYAGVRVFAACPQVDSTGNPSYAFDLNFMWRAKVGAKQPL